MCQSGSGQYHPAPLLPEEGWPKAVGVGVAGGREITDKSANSYSGLYHLLTQVVPTLGRNGLSLVTLVGLATAASGLTLRFGNLNSRIENLRMYPKGNLSIPASHGQLEAILKEPSGTPKGVGLVCHPHPLGGGTMHNKVVFRAAAGLVDAGVTTLRFNFRGVGTSTGTHEEVSGGREDVRDALEYLAKEYPGQPITLAGFSFGSRTGMEVGMTDNRVVRLISIGTPLDKYGDYAFLAAVRKPILFVHGDRDEFGSVENVRKLVEQIPTAELVVFENCGHFFDEHLNELRDTVKRWTEKEITSDKVKTEK